MSIRLAIGKSAKARFSSPVAVGFFWLGLIGLGALGGSARAASPPDAFEGAPYQDDASTTTLNVLPYNSPQDHTLHAESDVDWGICVQTSLTGTPDPYSLQFTNLTIPSGTAMVVEVYENGPEDPPTKTAYFTSLDHNRNVSWTGDGIKRVYCRVHSIGAVEPAMSYDVAFAKPTGANNGLATATGSSVLLVQWDTDGTPADALGYNVLRSLTGEPGSFVVVNPTLISLPNPLAGWMEYPDTGLQPATIYFYQIEYLDSGGNPVPFVPTFCGYTNPESPAEVEEWRKY